MTEQGPVVLLLDDLHWADVATIAAVKYLQRRGASVPGAVVAAIRLEDAPPEHLLHELETDALVRLEPLTAAELAPLGIAGLHASTGGNPRFVTEAAAHRGEQPLATAFGEALIAQCRAEGAFAYRALLSAAAARGAVRPGELALLVRADPVELVEELERLCERRILRVDGARFRFRYGLVRDVLAASLSPARKQMLHAQLRDAAASPSRRRGRPAGRGSVLGGG